MAYLGMLGADLLWVLLMLLLGDHRAPWTGEWDTHPADRHAGRSPMGSVAGTLSLDVQMAEARSRARRKLKNHPKSLVPIAVLALCRAMAEASGTDTKVQWEAMERMLRRHEAFERFRQEDIDVLMARAAKACRPWEEMVDDLRHRFPKTELPAILELLEEVMRADGEVWEAERQLLDRVRERLAKWLPPPSPPAKAD